ncbi:hypothetical protein [Aliikangiella sp. G2MR2-5]|uniref:hypothetical protein n=1 Tax=Aliikangiella sp. G2MR2-5 TaxID=2788943 RepID=UPI0018AAC845|nr:hypothetical protein [Aliikangiella sp. G2MR2-5]
MNSPGAQLCTFNAIILRVLIPFCVSLTVNSETSENLSTFNTTSDSTYDSTNLSDCPQGFRQSAVANVCIANELASLVVSNLSRDGKCEKNYEQIIGTLFCTEKKHFVSARETTYLIAGKFESYCPENHSRPQDSDICLDIKLSLIKQDQMLKLINPDGGGTSVPPDEAVGLFAAPPIECEPGFIKPPGFHFCIANNLALVAEPQEEDFEIPRGECPLNWSRKIDGGFCLPDYNLHICGRDFNCEQMPGDNFRISKEPLSCPEGYLKKQVNIPSFDTSNPDNFTTIPAYACVPPDKFDH